METNPRRDLRSSTRRRGRPGGTDSSKTRERLLRVARDILTEKGLARATIREIAERARVNPALLHYYFGTKSGLHNAVLGQIAQQFKTRFGERGSETGSARQQLRSLLREFVQLISQEPYVAHLLIQKVVSAENDQDRERAAEVGRPLIDHLQRVLSRGAARGEFREMDSTLLVSAIVTNCLSFFLVGPLLDPAQTSQRAVEDWADSVEDLILNGIGLTEDRARA